MTILLIGFTFQFFIELNCPVSSIRKSCLKDSSDLQLTHPLVQQEYINIYFTTQNPYKFLKVVFLRLFRI
ncbi:hypothetical protein SRABI134_04810 [Peribacillus sp. Bi134]|nr:hypothetical protein SRABI134_04810 [Peribacillus sp. Bi134]